MLRWEGRMAGRLGAMGWSKHSIPTGFSTIENNVPFGEARDAAMKSDAATKGQSMSAIIVWWSFAK